MQEGKGNALQKIQLIVLNMLSEQGIAEHTANGFHIGAEDIAGMDSEQADILRLPRRFMGRFQTSISGRTGNSGFRVGLALKWLKASHLLAQRPVFVSDEYRALLAYAS